MRVSIVTTSAARGQFNRNEPHDLCLLSWSRIDGVRAMDSILTSQRIAVDLSLTGSYPGSTAGLVLRSRLGGSVVLLTAARAPISSKPSIRAKALSRHNYPGRCESTAFFGSEVEDQDSGNLTLNHSRRNIVPPTIDSTQSSAMILLCEHPVSTGCESAHSVSRSSFR
jgi:hypothetical protein